MLVMILTGATLHAQSRWEAGVGVGGVGYLNKQDLLSKEFHAGISGHVRKYLNDFIALCYNFQVGRLCGRDSHYPDRRSRNLMFESRFMENALLVEWDFYNINPVFYRQRYGFQSIFSPYFFTGIALIYNNPEPTFKDTQTPYTWIQEGIDIDQNARYPHSHIAFPIGAGIKYDLSPEWTLGLEITFRIATTDYLDGISYSGNPKRNDAYQMANLHLTRRLGLSAMKIRRKW
ncbi:DUF6089 family protein [Runella sp.]|uniref:DUF6089 family protein n=1 Tax=Runella sp. TaxID=1960881 RepID=UPI0026253A1D|nr:DUF6089 family protein [Runella sp.]